MMSTRFSLLLLAAIVGAASPSLARDVTKPDDTADRRDQSAAEKQPGTPTPGKYPDAYSRWQYSQPQVRRNPRRLSDNPYSLKHRPIPAMNSPYSQQRRNTNVYRDQSGRALGYSIRRPDGRTQYRQFRGRGSKSSMPFGWQ